MAQDAKKCLTLEQKVKDVVALNNIDASVEKVTDLSEIMNYGIMMTPGLVVNEKVVSSGTIPNDKQILNWLKGA